MDALEIIWSWISATGRAIGQGIVAIYDWINSLPSAGQTVAYAFAAIGIFALIFKAFKKG